MEEQSRLEAWFHYCNDFLNHLQNSKGVLALIGAGLSASSGIPTYQGSGSSWRGYLARDLSTRGRFERDPSLVGAYYRYRQAKILSASPNAGHIALARLASTKDDFLTITQNVDDLSQRAGHALDPLIPIHGSLLDLCCTNLQCEFRSHVSNQDSLCPELPDNGFSGTSSTTPPPPLCPTCGALLRPAIVRFGDQLHPQQADRIEHWFARHDEVHLMLVIGCAASVSPAADYIDRAKEKGARIAVFNLSYEQQSLHLGPEDWYFPGDASLMLPLLLRRVIEEM